ncbi:MAG TPA: YceI family protein [Streptosporangiaceae bacterium]|nr:YceI family protein [Streptosporangiaceae bacterium]
MALHAGRLQFGAERGRIALLTARDGLAAQAGHDLTIEVAHWSADLEIAADLTPAGLTVRADINSLVVREGTGGVKPLTDRDRREIAVTARRLLRADRHPVATFTASEFDPGRDGGGVVRGTLSLAGTERPLRLQVVKDTDAAYHATASVRQSDFGVKPYTAFLGVLKVSDAVSIAVDVELPSADHEAGAGEQP